MNLRSSQNRNIFISAYRIAIVAGALLLTAPAALAADSISLAPTTSSSTQNQANRIARLKARADNEINRRAASLSKLLSRIPAMKKLSDTDKSSLTGQIQDAINNLNSLKAKVAADTDLVTLRADVQSIVKSYRIYALFIPKIRLLAAADLMGAADDNLSQLANKLQARIQAAQSKGQSISSLQASLDDMNTKIADAKSQYSAAESEVLPLTPDGYPGNKASLQEAQAKLKTGRQDLKAAREDARTITSALKTLWSTRPSPSKAAAP